jgi:hypothetical protein
MKQDVVELKRRIRRGYYWLKVHSINVSDPDRFQKNLTLYEKLVDQATELGISEQDCLNFEKTQLIIDGLTDEEVLGALSEGESQYEKQQELK